MAVTSSIAGKAMDFQMQKKWKERETSPQRTPIWIEPPHTKLKSNRKVPVVYYISRNGQLEHPHFMEVPLSSPEGLYLRDVINRLNLLRGKGMAAIYSWSSKRSYKSGFVWHDLEENDFIYPAHGQEYVLKGSELLDTTLTSKSDETVSSNSKKTSPETRQSGDYSDSPVIVRRRNQSWSAIDLHEYKVYKAESTSDSAGKAAANASTQTDEKRRRRREIREIEEEEEKEGKDEEPYQNQSTELRRDEISPPPSDSSPETLETLMKADGSLILRSETLNDDPTVSNLPSGRAKASSVLMQLISCGSISFKDRGTGYGKDPLGFSLISHYKARVPRGVGSNQVRKDMEEALKENTGFGGKIKLEDKEYFSGSLVETKKDEFPALKRSSSCNAERSSQMELAEKEIEGVRAKCIPRKPKTQSSKKQSNNDTCCSTTSTTCSRSIEQGSKKLVVQQ